MFGYICHDCDEAPKYGFEDPLMAHHMAQLHWGLLGHNVEEVSNV